VWVDFPAPSSPSSTINGIIENRYFTTAPAANVIRPPLPQHAHGPFDTGSKRVGLLHRIVKCERSTYHARHPVMVHDRVGAARSGTHGDAELIEYHAHVVGMHAFHVERQDAALVRSRSVDAQSFDGTEPFGGIRRKVAFVRGDTVRTDALYIFDGLAEAN